jgi:cell wall-associated NlpC family hydrolase
MASYDIAQIAGSWKHSPYLYGGDSHVGIDCSHFVWEVIKAAGHPQAPYLSTGSIPGSFAYSAATEPPEVGDIILFDGHMGIVVDTTTQTFMGAQSHGVEPASYAKGSYWGNLHHRFYRYTGP